MLSNLHAPLPCPYTNKHPFVLGKASCTADFFLSCTRGQALISQRSDWLSAVPVGLGGVPGDAAPTPGLRRSVGLAGEAGPASSGAEQEGAPCQQSGGRLVPFLPRDGPSTGTAGLPSGARASVLLQDIRTHRKAVEIPSAAHACTGPFLRRNL